MINTNYWYHKQIRTLLLHTLRLFQNFCISEGIDEEGKPILRKVPCTHMSKDKSVAYMLNNATDTVLETCPKMILTISNVKLNSNLQSGAPYFESESSVNFKKFNEETGNYEYNTGESYNITRHNPLPLGLEFKLYILTSMLDQKLQLFEQIRSLFTPTLELQISENPLDWSRLTAITLTGLNWSSIGTTSLDSTTLDAMDMTFEVNTNLDLPSLVQRERIIDTIVTSIGEGNSIDDIMSWSLEDVSRTFHTPNNNAVEVFTDDNNALKIKLLPYMKKYTSWGKLLETYGIIYNEQPLNTFVDCISNANVDKRTSISGSIQLDESNPTEAFFNISHSTLPQPTISPIDEIIDPHNFNPDNTDGRRYLITEDISNCNIWGKFFKDGIELSDTDVINSNSIIEYSNNHWNVSLDPNISRGVYYVKDNSNPMSLYTFNNEHNIWTDVVCKTYPIGMWRLSETTNK